MMATMNVVLLGSRSEFTARALASLADGALEVRAVFVHVAAPAREAPTPRERSLPVAGPEAVADIAARVGARVEEVADINAAPVLERLAAYAPEAVVAACFPRILGPRALSVARRGCFNLHPSPLPAYRGPAPLFWQFRAGERATAVTMHRMSECIDQGGIVARATLELAAGERESALSAQLAAMGGRLAAAALPRIAAGELRAEAQDEARASYFPWPEAGAFEISTRWPAERAYRFMAGTREWGRSYTLATAAGGLALLRAIDFDARATQAGAVERAPGVVSIRFSPGVLRAVEARRA